MKRFFNEMNIKVYDMEFTRTVIPEAVASYISAFNPTEDELSDIKHSVSEAINNCNDHAYPDCIGLIYVRCRVLKNREVEIVVKDNGRGIADISQARQVMFTTSDPKKHSGMGFTIMESFMDKLIVRSKPGRYTSITMRKRLI